MAENGGNLNNSQESLPLSQESYQQLFRELGGSLSNIMHNDLDVPFLNEQACDVLVNSYINNNVNQLESNLQEESQSKDDLKFIEWSSVVIPTQSVGHNLLEQKRSISSLPACQNWTGIYGFSISFNPQTVKKGISWIFSNEERKLYVGKNVPCPVNFSTNTPMLEEVFVRAVALFSCSDNASEIVTRCVNHSMEEIKKNVFEAEHFIRSESQSALYENDPLTGRHSVIIPYENPPAGQMYSTYLYKFMCFGSCSGGPNRRPLMVVFTLEKRGEVIGRQHINLKVCACPGRDFKQSQAQGQLLKEKKPVKRPNTDILTDLPKKIKENEKKKKYTLTTDSRRCYLFLKKMKRLHTFYSNINSYYPGLSRLIYTSSQSSSEDADDETKYN